MSTAAEMLLTMEAAQRALVGLQVRFSEFAPATRREYRVERLALRKRRKRYRVAAVEVPVVIVINPSTIEARGDAEALTTPPRERHNHLRGRP